MAIETIELISLTDRAISFTRRFANTVRYHHWHQCLEILVIEQGYGIIIVDNQQYTLRPGRVFIFPPFKLHKVMVDERYSDNYRRTIIHLDNAALVNFLRDFPHQRASLQRLCHKSSVASVYDLSEYQTGLEQLFTVYQRIFDSQQFNLSDSACLMLQLLNFFPQRTENSEQIDDSISTRVMQWIEEHYREKFSLAALAASLSLSRSYVSRTFKQETGGLIHEYLLTRRVRQACEYLRADELAVDVIAEKTGFADTSYFITCFKKMIGDTPLKYRKRHQDNGV
ncbi:AraC family transcriptional regulator [Winslowiella iniecta]|uniref:Arabinose operon regulatory protein n=1 Tax=Winslowiella iniecta TaxID=1560201 RepID=A0A0L7TEV4_9GAMM|nr:AraC family transcriptional regulator [Winslowiella iniecta]KOC89546.1 AraC family transcriptional regulator [Winslowiella iniecta]KOC93902.1 AraC family transcriptional regulator [Winslowiella iniecta]